MEMMMILKTTILAILIIKQIIIANSYNSNKKNKKHKSVFGAFAVWASGSNDLWPAGLVGLPAEPRPAKQCPNSELSTSPGVSTSKVLSLVA